MFCGNCGQKIVDQAVFCPRCGTNVKARACALQARGIAGAPAAAGAAAGVAIAHAPWVVGGATAAAVVQVPAQSSLACGQLATPAKAAPAQADNLQWVACSAAALAGTFMFFPWVKVQGISQFADLLGGLAALFGQKAPGIQDEFGVFDVAQLFGWVNSVAGSSGIQDFLVGMMSIWVIALMYLVAGLIGFFANKRSTTLLAVGGGAVALVGLAWIAVLSRAQDAVGLDVLDVTMWVPLSVVMGLATVVCVILARTRRSTV